jgi:hypothetical protein
MATPFVRSSTRTGGRHRIGTTAVAVAVAVE